MSLSKKQVQNVCRMYSGSFQCRYLEIKGYNGDACCLKKTGLAVAINKKANEVAAKLKASSQDPNLQGIPLGNPSCSGYPYLPGVKFGYDVNKK